jgi:hypothetical protein
MAEFAISFSLTVEADSYQEAWDLQTKLRGDVGKLPEVMDVTDIDLEHLEGDLEEVE